MAPPGIGRNTVGGLDHPANRPHRDQDVLVNEVISNRTCPVRSIEHRTSDHLDLIEDHWVSVAPEFLQAPRMRRVHGTDAEDERRDCVRRGNEVTGGECGIANGECGISDNDIEEFLLGGEVSVEGPDPNPRHLRDGIHTDVEAVGVDRCTSGVDDLPAVRECVASQRSWGLGKEVTLRQGFLQPPSQARRARRGGHGAQDHHRGSGARRARRRP